MSNFKRMRALNASQTPRSSLGRALQVHSQDQHHDPHDGRAAKRQKHDKATSKSSPYFIAGELSANKGDYEDLTFDGPPSEAVDLVSVSSAGKTQAVTTGQPEYRRTQIPVKANGRRRRRRSEGPGSQPQKEIHVVDTDSIVVNERKPDSYVDISRDNSGSPPPAKIVSDIPQKRNRPANHQDATQISVKRPRNALRKRAESISDDEDELAGSGPLQPRGTVRTTNFSRLTGRIQHRGDIQRTAFKPAHAVEAGHIPSESPKMLEIRVVKAACHKSIYPPDGGQGRRITLQLGPQVSKVVPSKDQRTIHIPWLEMDLSKVQKVEHNVTNSQYVIIVRASTTDAPSPLSLELETPGDAMKLITWLSQLRQDLCQFKEQPISSLETKFKRNFGISNTYEHQNTPQQRTKEMQSQSFSKPAPDKNSLAYLRDPFRPNPRPEKLKDKMQGSNTADEPKPTQEFPSESVASSTRAQRMETRRTRKASPEFFEREASPDRWTVLNPNWGENWQGSLVFPPTGRNRATVDKDDISRLDEGEFLNDNLINFYFRYLQQKLEAEKPEMLEKVYFFSTFFYEKLRANRGKVNYDGVKAWTAKVDLLSYKYIIVPVNENAHWYLAIIYNAPRTLPDANQQDDPADAEEVEVGKTERRSPPSVAAIEQDISFISLEDEPTNLALSIDVAESSPATIAINDSQEAPVKSQLRRPSGSQKLDPDLPRIITLDSLGSSHSPTCRFLKDYLAKEAEDKKGVELSLIPVGLTAKNIPEQNNYCDCGVFILGYIEEFLKNPDEAIRKLIQKEDLGWDIRPSKIRNEVRDLLFLLKKEQQQRLDKEKEEKRKRRAQKASTASANPGLQARQEVTNHALQPSKEVQSTPLETKPATNGVLPVVRKGGEKEHRSEPLPKAISPTREKMETPITKSDKEPGFIEPLEEESNEENITSSGNICLSNPSSPFKKPDVKAAVDLTGSKEKPNRGIAISPGNRHSSEFVRALSATTDEMSTTKDEILVSLESKARRERHERTTSPEKVKTKHTVSQFPATYMKSRPEPQLLPSIETDHSSSGPQYDGVERSIDLTIESQ